MAMRAVKKITAKDVMGKSLEKIEVSVPVLNEDNTPIMHTVDGKEVPVMRKVKVVEERDIYAVFGQAQDGRIVTSNFGNSLVFQGNFEARRLSDGEIFVSTECIFPPIAAELAEAAWLRERAKNPNGSVEFAFVVGVTPDTKGTEGFKFTCKPIKVGEATSDPLAEMKSSLGLSFAAALGLETMTKIGLPAPGSETVQIDGDGVIQEPASKGRAKADA